jgi:O-acetyl-ADP-ribose deacetylase (regulator of RNase III)
VSAGAYGWPLYDAARIALTTVAQARTRVHEARFVLFTEAALATFRSAFHATGAPPDIET